MSLLINFLVVTIFIFTIKLKNVASNPLENYVNSDLTLRITNGAQSKPGKFKFVAGIGSLDHNHKTTVCGGALISPNTVLTSVGCVEMKTNITVILGATNLTKGAPEPNRQTIECANVIIHPNYDRYWVQPNLAIIKLAQPAEIDGYVDVVHLPMDDTDDYAGIRGTSFGWGHTSNEDTRFNIDRLRYAGNRILTNENCLKDNEFLKYILNDHLICQAGYEQRGVCKGDAGSPLVILAQENLLVGVLSFGHKECGKGHPAAFTRVSKYLDWIHENSH